MPLPASTSEQPPWCHLVSWGCEHWSNNTGGDHEPAHVRKEVLSGSTFTF